MSVIENSDLWKIESENKAKWTNFEKGKPILWGFRFGFPSPFDVYDVRNFTIISTDQERAELALINLLAQALNIKPQSIRVDQRSYIHKVHFIDPDQHKILHNNYQPSKKMVDVQSSLVK